MTIHHQNSTTDVACGTVDSALVPLWCACAAAELAAYRAQAYGTQASNFTKCCERDTKALKERQKKG